MRRLAFTLLAIAALMGPLPAGADRWMSGPDRHPVPLERSPSGVWIVEATLNGGVRGRFLLDTGATWCGVTSRTAARLRLPQIGEQVRMQTAGGVVPMPLVRIGSVDVGGQRARDVQAVILPDDLGGLDGIIGTNFLDAFVYAIDPRRSELHLR